MKNQTESIVVSSNEQKGVIPASAGSSVLYSILKGSVQGGTEVAFNHPLWTIKTRLQDKTIAQLPLALRIKAAFYNIKNTQMPIHSRVIAVAKGLYCGISANMASMVPITAIQVATATALKKVVSNNDKDSNDRGSKIAAELQRVLSSYAGGSISALVGAPTELIMQHMNNTRGFIPTMKAIVSRPMSAVAAAAALPPNATNMHNSAAISAPIVPDASPNQYPVVLNRYSRLLTGLAGTMNRDGIFTVGYMEAPKIVENALLVGNCSPTIAAAVSAPIAGVLAATLSHPLDTSKTRQQAVVMETETATLWGAAKNIINEEGWKGLFKGYTPRAIRVVSAITIMDIVGRNMDARFKR